MGWIGRGAGFSEDHSVVVVGERVWDSSSRVVEGSLVLIEVLVVLMLDMVDEAIAPYSC